MAQMIKNLSAMQETCAGSLDQKDPLEKRKATHSSILAWEIPWTEKPGVLQSMGSKRNTHDWIANTCTFFFFSVSITKILFRENKGQFNTSFFHFHITYQIALTSLFLLWYKVIIDQSTIPFSAFSSFL